MRRVTARQSLPISVCLIAGNEAARKVDEQMTNQMGSLAGGLNIPGLT